MQLKNKQKSQFFNELSDEDKEKWYTTHGQKNAYPGLRGLTTSASPRSLDHVVPEIHFSVLVS